LSKEPTMHRHRAVQVDHLQTQFASFVKWKMQTVLHHQ
jgi:hypothetical protein